MPDRRALVVPVALLGLTLAACGSTVQRTSTISGARSGITTSDGTGDSAAGTADGSTDAGTADGGATDAGGDATTADGTAGDPGTADTTTTTTTGGSGTTTGSTGGGTATQGGSAAKVPAQTSASSIPSKGFGYDDKKVYIGIVTQKDSQAAFAAVGDSGVDPGDTQAQANAVAADINGKGGLYGRQVVVVAKDVATVDSAQNPDAAGATVCTYFSQDQPVVAVISIVSTMDTASFRSCLAKAKIPLFQGSFHAEDDVSEKALAPYFYQLTNVSWSALAPAFVARLKAQNYFTGWDSANAKPSSVAPVKVGILVDGTDVGKRVGDDLKAAVTAAGYTAVVYSYSDASQGQSSSAIYFKGNGVTHVIATDIQLTAFQSSAGQQGYTPRYGISTYNDPYSNLENNGGLTPASQNAGAVGVGWAPAFDVNPTNDPPVTPGLKACLDLMAKGGQTFSGKRLAQGFAMAVCDGVQLTAQGAAAGGGLTGAQIGAGIAKIGAGYQPGTGFAPALTPDKHFVSGELRDLAWDTSCSCFKYGSGSSKI